MSNKLRIMDSAQLAEGYEQVLELEQALLNMEEENLELDSTTIEVPLALLVRISACYKFAYEHLINTELIPYGTKQLFNLKNTH